MQTPGVDNKQPILTSNAVHTTIIALELAYVKLPIVCLEACAHKHSLGDKILEYFFFPACLQYYVHITVLTTNQTAGMQPHKA